MASIERRIEALEERANRGGDPRVFVVWLDWDGHPRYTIDGEDVTFSEFEQRAPTDILLEVVFDDQKGKGDDCAE